ncbi:MAG: glucose 1-dehydrogenase [Thermoleophilaceae bacterium]|nr:glucose 1-dehydrogenase [Thermoleophilaceae bacterium]
MSAVPREGASAPSPLSGRRAVVTGAASGIGRATALRLAADGALVAVNHIDTPGDAEAVVDGVAAAGSSGVAVGADVSKEADVARLFEQAAEGLGGPVDLLVNNAGVESSHGLQDMPLEEWERVLGVNLTGPFLCSREFVRRLPRSARPAVIVNVSSVHEVIPWPTFSHYCASKGGLKLFAQTIAKELAPRGIRVAAVAPGAILTPINRRLVEDEESRRRQEEQIPLGRLGEPGEIAAAIAWLAGPDAAYVTGETLFVDGGMTLYEGFA